MKATFVLRIFCAILLITTSLAGLSVLLPAGMFRACRRRTGLDNLTLRGFSSLVILGMAGALANLFFPLPPLAASLICALGLSLFILFRSRILEGYDRQDLLIHTGILLWLSLRVSMNDSFLMDTGVYHLQAIQWIQESRIPLGLANLEGKLGFSTLWFPVAALLENSLWTGRISFLLSPAILFFFFSAVLSAHKRVLRSVEAETSSLFLILTAGPAAGFGMMTAHRASTSIDLPVMLLTLLIFSILLRRKTGEPENSLKVTSLALVFAAFALTLKLSAAVVFAGTGLVWLFDFSAAAKQKNIPVKHCLLLGTFILILFLVWGLRGMALSGCLAFPMPWGCFEGLSWAVPETALYGEIEVVRSWARLPLYESAAVLASTDWIRPWLGKMGLNVMMRLVAATFFLSLLLQAYVKSRSSKSEIRDRSWFVPALIAAAGCVFWLVTAPDPRFGYGVLYGLALLPLAAGLSACWGNEFSPARGRIYVTAFLVLVVLIPLAKAPYRFFDAWHWPELPEVETRISTSANDVIIHTPVKGFACWRAPLPCAVYVRDYLHAENGRSNLPVRFWYPEALRKTWKWERSPSS